MASKWKNIQVQVNPMLGNQDQERLERSDCSAGKEIQGQDNSNSEFDFSNVNQQHQEHVEQQERVETPHGEESIKLKMSTVGRVAMITQRFTGAISNPISRLSASSSNTKTYRIDKVSYRTSFIENLKTASSVGHESEGTLGEALLQGNRTVAIFLIIVGVILIPLKNEGTSSRGLIERVELLMRYACVCPKAQANVSPDLSDSLEVKAKTKADDGIEIGKMEIDNGANALHSSSSLEDPTSLSSSINNSATGNNEYSNAFRRFGRIWYILVRLGVLMLLAYSFDALRMSATATQLDDYNRRANIIAFITTFLQGVSVLISTYQLTLRVRQKFPVYILDLFAQNARTCIRFMALLTIISFLVPILFAVGDPITQPLSLAQYAAAYSQHFFIWFTPHFFVSILLSGNLLFVLVDADAAILLIEEMIVHKERVQKSEFDAIKEEIDANIKASFWVNFASTIIAVVNLGVMCFYAFSHPNKNKAFFMGVELVFIKEVLFLVIIFLRCSTVNERSDTLIDAFAMHACESPSLETITKYIYASKKKITYTLAGMRVTKSGMIWQATIVVAGITIAALQNQLDIHFPWEKD